MSMILGSQLPALASQDQAECTRSIAYVGI